MCIPPTSGPELEALLERARNLPPMTKEQIAEQRKSWVVGEMMLEHPEMTREEILAIYEKVV